MFGDLSQNLLRSDALVSTMARSSRFLLGARGCMVTFHRAATNRLWESLPNNDFYIDLDFLDKFLRHLTKQGWDVVTIDEALDRSERLGDTAGYVNFSVDDCYRDTFEQVVPLFHSHGMPVTLFVTTGIPDGTLPLWSAGLEEVLLLQDRVLTEGGSIAVATTEAKREAYRQIAASWDNGDAGAHYKTFCVLNGVDPDAIHRKHAISWEMLNILRNDPLVEIGAHSVNHSRLSSLTSEQALHELRGSRQRLIDQLGVRADHFAFPYGRSGDCGPREFALARQAGFSSASTTVKGLMRKGQDRFSLHRNTINGSHRNLSIMELHLAGLTGIAARIAGRV